MVLDNNTDFIQLLTEYCTDFMIQIQHVGLIVNYLLDSLKFSYYFWTHA